MKKIAIASFAASIAGLVAETLPLSDSFHFSKIVYVVQMVNYLLHIVNLSFFNSSLFGYQNPDSTISWIWFTNYFNVAFYLVLFIGAIIYLRSSYKETRLIRFSFSVIFLANTLVVFSFLFSFGIYFSHSKSFLFLSMLLLAIKSFFWIYCSWKILKKIGETKSLEKEPVDMIGNTVYRLMEASRNERFFHFVMDTVIFVLIFSSISATMVSLFFRQWTAEIGERYVLYFLLVIFRLIYYVVYEVAFGASPAKFLSETRVVTQSGEKIGIKASFLRTISRFVPFEPFSFFGSGSGWHDEWTDTTVVKEKRSGVKGGYYFLIFPGFLVAGLLGFFGYEQYSDYRIYLNQKSSYDEKITSIRQGLSDISTGDLVQIKDTKESYGTEDIYLKCEEIKGDVLVFSKIFTGKSSYEYTLPELGRFIESNKEFFERVEISKSDLDAAVTGDYDDYVHQRKNGVAVLKDGRKFEIERIVRLYAPVIRNRATGAFRSLNGEGSISLGLCNYGWPCMLTDVKNLEGEVQWNTSIPRRIEATGTDGSSSFEFNSANYKTGERYKVLLTFEDSLKRKHRYVLEGINLNVTVKRAE